MIWEIIKNDDGRFSAICLGILTDRFDTEQSAQLWVIMKMEEFLNNITNWDNPDESYFLLKAAPELVEACKRAKSAIYETINKRKAPLSSIWHDLEDTIAKAEKGKL